MVIFRYTIDMNEQAQQIQRSNSLKLIWGLVCLIAPSALLILTFIAYSILKFILPSVTTDISSGASLAGSGSVGESVTHVILFLVGAVSVLTWLPGFIVGIILLSTRKQV